jgi:hypothetical protein
VTDSSGPPGGSNLPARRLSSSELEAVIRRAVEIQSATGAPDEGISEGEVLRIGQELGLDAVTVRRAIVDVRGRAPEETGALARVMGPGVVRAARTVRRPPAQVGLLLEEYLLACEYMVVQRRFPDRTRYVRATGVGATFGRAAQKFGSKHKMLELQQLDVAVSAIDDSTALVELSVDVTSERGVTAIVGASVGGGAGISAAVFAIATTIPDPLALVGLPIAAGIIAGMRGIFGVVRRTTQEKLESFLDRLEHGELKVPGRGGGGDGGGGITIGPPGFGIRIGPGGPRGRR